MIHQQVTYARPTQVLSAKADAQPQAKPQAKFDAKLG
ncbi:MAG: hypothetical protein JWN15_677 [Firmicutes bacterium]|nr:hypothetical protein [Bacillota bacterium]